MRVKPHGLGYGGLNCTASALAQLLRDLLAADSVLLSGKAKQLLFAQQTTSDGKPIPSCLGWVIGSLHGLKYFGKQGGGLGFHGNVQIYPALGLATVLLVNTTEVTAGPIDQRSNRADCAVIAWARH